ncbi:SH3-like domain-containing protein [Bailinhaonella thermotolerans]|uniref:SH3-like domain-containing protein n=1 Tax=Bailinhaonella thermotolerans TaxID=1070861 RepID=UPI00192A5DBE
MSRVHDMGGQTGFGPVPAGDERAFHADWEARVVAVDAVLRRRGVYVADEFRDAIERIPPGEYLSAGYYERRLIAIETLLDEKGIA